MLTFRMRGPLAKLTVLSGLVLLGILTFSTRHMTSSGVTRSVPRSHVPSQQRSATTDVTRSSTKVSLEFSTKEPSTSLTLMAPVNDQLQGHQGQMFEMQSHLSKPLEDLNDALTNYTGGVVKRAGGRVVSGGAIRKRGGRMTEMELVLGNRTLSIKAHPVGGGRKMFQYAGIPSNTTTTRHPLLTGNHSSPSDAEAALPRVLCWILTDPNDLEKRTRHVRDTWARRCDVTLYMSSAKNDSFPTIGLKVLQGRNHIASKAKAAWRYIYKHHLNDADFFVKADPDTYIILENLKEYLSHESPAAVRYYGHRFHQASWGYTYMSGGSGLVLTREALSKLVNSALNLKPNCMPDGQGEDWKTAKCLSLVGGEAVDTRDEAGRERFMVFTPSVHITGHYPQWYVNRDPDGALKGTRCCSDYPISFHYIKPEQMYVLDYFLYRARPHGKEAVRL